MLNTSKIEQENIPVIKEIKCRRIIVSPKKKGAIIGYCIFCRHVSEFTNDETCICCTTKKGIKRNPTYVSWIKRFDSIIEDNQVFLEGFRLWPSKTENRFYAWVKMGLFTYVIDIRYFADYMDIVNQDNNNETDKYAMFFEYIKKTCPRIAI